MSGASERVHATAIAVGRRGALIRGPSGSGKSDLALRCLGLAPSVLLREPVQLIADDQVVLQRTDAGILATCPAPLRGRLEVRGLGILDLEARSDAGIVLIVDLLRDEPINRLPDPWPKAELLGLEIALLRLHPFAASAPEKLVAALAMAPLPRGKSKT